MLHTGDYTAAFALLQKLLDSSRYWNFMQYFPRRIQVHLSTPPPPVHVVFRPLAVLSFPYNLDLFLKNSISYRGSIVWNLLEPSAVSARDYAKRAKKSHALRNLNFNEESPQMGRPQIDSDFVFY